MSIVTPKNGYFPITSVHRNDLADHGFDVSNVTDEQMERLAEKMGGLYVEFGGFWEAMEDLAKEMGIPRIEGINKKGFCTKCGSHVSTHNDDGSCVKDDDEQRQAEGALESGERTTSFEIYFDDLHEEAQARYLEFEKVEDPSELNAELSPLCILERSDDDETVDK
jgi:hypothetical protein